MAATEEAFEKFLDCVRERSSGKHRTTAGRREALFTYWTRSWGLGVTADNTPATLQERYELLETLVASYEQALLTLQRKPTSSESDLLHEVTTELRQILKELVGILRGSQPKSETEEAEQLCQVFRVLFPRDDNLRWQAYLFAMTGELAHIADEKSELLKIEAACRDKWFNSAADSEN